MTERRTRGEGGLRWNEKRQRWIAEVTVGYDGRGKRIVRSASGRTRTEAKAKLRELKKAEAAGITSTNSTVTVRQVVDDWLTFGLPRRSGATVDKYKILAAKHIYCPLGARKVRDLSAAEVDRWLSRLASTLSTRTLRELRSILSRAVNRAMARDLVHRNVVDLTEIPQGRDGRRSKSLTAEQVDAVLTLTASDRLHHYIVVSLLTGARTEELRALRWDHVHLDGDPDARPPIPPHLEVWRSVRQGGDTKTRKSRRTLALPLRCVGELRAHRARQAAARRLAGDGWQDNDLVFSSEAGTPLDAANVRRGFRRIGDAAGLTAKDWTPRELRHSFVSLLSDSGVPIEQISRLVGHSGTAVTELVYRKQIRPVLHDGATVMDRIFNRPQA